ncbi:MAG: transcriptional regulator [Bacteroidia bacterium]
MRLSKIGSVNTYIKCIKELDKWQYIKYVPSHNPLKGSLVNLYNFNNTNDNATDISNDKSNNKTHEKTNGNTKKQLVIPSINTINNTNQSNGLNNSTLKVDEKNNLISKGDETKERKKVAPKKESKSLPAQPKNKKPTAQEVANYFTSKMCTAAEGEKFFNYFESNGWLVGGKTPMKNWHAAANNWIMNIDKFKNNGTHKQESKSGAAAGLPNSRAGHLHSTTDKNFSEPL